MGVPINQTNNHYIKYIRVVDNTGYENYLEKEQVYGVLEHMIGDIACYYKLDTGSPYKEGLWVSVARCSDMPTGYPFRGVELKHTIDLQSMIKPTVERIICIPNENGHVVDLQRVQYVSPLDDGSYTVTLVSGWEIKLRDEVYSREKLIRQWKMLQNR